MKGLAILFLLFASPAFAAFPHASTTAGPGILHGCYDGDSCSITIPSLPDIFGDKLGLRLVGIDTPEIRGKCEAERSLAKQARDFLNQYLTGAHEITVQLVARDKYFRALALIEADGADLSDALVQAGLARPYEGDTKLSWCVATPPPEDQEPHNGK